MSNRAKYLKIPISLPFEFQLSKYRNTKKLGASDWLYQLHFRKYVLDNLSYHIKNKSDNLMSDDITSILKYGIVLKDQISSKGYGKKKKGGVQFLTRREAYLFSSLLEQDKKEKKLNNIFGKYSEDSLATELNSCDDVPSEQISLFYNEPIDFYLQKKQLVPISSYGAIIYGDRIHVTVDLSESNEQLCSNFSEILKQAREKRNLYNNTRQEKCLKKLKRGDFNKATFTVWAQRRVLAYIDLRILTTFYKITLKNWQIAQLLDKRVSELQDSIRPLADYLMDWNLLHKLASHIRQPPRI